MRSRRGFSLVEVVVVLATIGLLGVIVGYGAVAVVGDVEGRSAEGNAQAVLLAQQRLATQYGSYSAAPADLDDVREVTVVTGLSSGPDQVAVAVGVDGSLGIAVRRSSDACVLVTAESLAAGGKVSQRSADRSACTAADALPPLEAEDTAARDRSVTS